jgi:50S ribosomal protein L16 3-hydroxylase
MKSVGLAALTTPLKLDDFFFKNWPKEPLVIHELNDSIESLTKLPFLQSLDALLNAWPNTVSVHLPDVRDESSAIETTPTEARKLFRNKMALLFNNVQKISPELQLWLTAIKNDLGLPTSTFSRCMVYATPDGKGTAPHFDQNINFVIQLHGTKTWWIEENKSVENPTERFTMGQTIDPELASYTENIFPTKMSSNRQEIVLTPGSMLFVPRGYWHSTEAKGEALALNFTFSQPTWADLFTSALKSRLNLSPEWRDLADGVTSRDPAKKDFAQMKLDLLLADLILDLPNWTAADIINSTEV